MYKDHAAQERRRKAMREARDLLEALQHFGAARARAFAEFEKSIQTYTFADYSRLFNLLAEYRSFVSVVQSRLLEIGLADDHESHVEARKLTRRLIVAALKVISAYLRRLMEYGLVPLFAFAPFEDQKRKIAEIKADIRFEEYSAEVRRATENAFASVEELLDRCLEMAIPMPDYTREPGLPKPRRTEATGFLGSGEMGLKRQRVRNLDTISAPSMSGAGAGGGGGGGRRG
ncbi:MAG: hypothetical protein FJX46_13770 [Alphaproteobacteria bacterium]|nr:hypothetical protein [Alphaproteobacteria bacterium]